LRKTVGFVVLGAGALGGSLSLPAALIVVLLAAGQGRGAAQQLPLYTAAFAVAMLGSGIGLALAYAGWHVASTPAPTEGPLVRLPAALWGLLALVIVVGMGRLAIRTQLYVMAPPLHLLAGILPSCFFVALVVRATPGRPEGLSWPGLAAAAGWGGGGATLAAGVLETVVLLVILGAVMGAMGVAQPDLLERLAQALNQMADGSGTPGWETLLQWMQRPLVVGLGVLGLGVVGPLIEETAKAIVVPLSTLSGARPSKGQAFLLGVVAGAGFTAVEGTLNGVLGIDSPSWALLMGSRLGTAAIHCAAAGLGALGWRYLLAEVNWRMTGRCWIAALALHGVWNAAAVFLAVSGNGSSLVRSGAPALPLVVMVVTVFASAGILLIAPRQLAEEVGAERDGRGLP
jgi:RsiW-degrading membrane proteinase PrsW (M82 family)